MLRRGRLSAKDEAYILDQAGRVSVEKIAQDIGRTPDMVERFIRKKQRFMRKQKQVVTNPAFPANPATTPVELFDIRQELRDSHRWSRMKQELTTEEIKYFEEEYVKLYAQFKNEVLPSEESQIFDAIKLDLLKSRNLIERKRAREEISRLEELMKKFYREFGDDPMLWDDNQEKKALGLETQLNVVRTAEQNKTTEFVKFQEHHNRLMENLKATRAQRVKEVESGKVSFMGLIKRMQEEQYAEFEGRMTGLMRLSADNEYNRLGQEHVYDDGQVDRPILSADTIDIPSIPPGPNQQAEEEDDDAEADDA